MIDATLVLDGTLPATGTAITVTRVSTNVWDTGSNRDIGTGDDINFNIIITETFLTLTSLQIAIQSSADNSAWVDLLLSPVILAANLLVGQRLTYKLPRKQLNDAIGGTPNRYLRLNYTVAGSTATAGAVMAWIGVDIDNDNFNAYPRNYAVASGS